VPKSSLPAEFVVSGPKARNIFDANQISSAAAKTIARACRSFAQTRNGSMSLYIIDTAGTLVHMERMDGQVFNNIRTAKLKAETALKTRQPTSIRAAQLRNDPSGAPRSVVWYDFFAVPGGIPIVVDGEMIGAIGVGGGAGGGDEACAMEGLKAAFGTRVTLPTYPAAAARPG
jgi:glc operon protein GlcG